MIKRICFAVAFGAAISLTAGAPSFAAGHKSLTVTLLGTGTPLPILHRFGPSILIEAGDKKLLFDSGRVTVSTGK